MGSTALEDSQSRSPTSLETLTHPQCFNYHTSLILLHIFRIRLGFGLLYSSSQQPFPQFSQLRLSCFRLRFSSLSTTIWTTHDRISISTYSVDKLWFLGTFKCSDGKKTQKCSNSSGRTQQGECAVQNAKTRRPKCITPLYMHPKSSSNPRPSRPPSLLAETSQRMDPWDATNWTESCPNEPRLLACKLLRRCRKGQRKLIRRMRVMSADWACREQET
jgi:hypothetical protein